MSARHVFFSKEVPYLNKLPENEVKSKSTIGFKAALDIFNGIGCYSSTFYMLGFATITTTFTSYNNNQFRNSYALYKFDKGLNLFVKAYNKTSLNFIYLQTAPAKRKNEATAIKCKSDFEYLNSLNKDERFLLASFRVSIKMSSS
ncbi:hypothetical protein BpHYR1_000377 [Brachionus plicatilis]|uniref:Uncharacterized protein n=1 Tax=Brachionus plicatilis TaxID=10195 RepID=A0A3M7Q4R1_BRAPC|nr:hypothetical protein BpHYR1_000377 [Brachionus plicatilis]